MTPPQETQHQGCADFFSELPPELRMEILNQTPIQDIRPLISASPALLRIFQSHRASLLRHHLQHLLQFYGDKSILPFVVFTMDLRALRAQSQHLTASELEEKLKPALSSIQSRKCTRQPSAGYLDFQILEKAQDLVPELCRAFYTYQEGPYNSTSRPSSHFLLEEASWQVKFTFIEKFLRFDCYCNMFYYRTQSLFSISNRVETKLESPLLHHPTNSVERFPRTIISTLFKGYQDLISRLDYSLRSRQPNPGDTPESPNPNISTLQRNEFLDRDMPQEQSYLSHLIMGGYPLFEKLQSLTAEEFEHYTLKEFYQVVTVKLTPVAFYALLTFTHMPLL